MGSSEFFRRHKSGILGAVLGALIGGVISLTGGLYILMKSFEFSQNKEFLSSLRSDITLLRKVERELDENLNLLLTQDYRIKVQFEELEFPLGKLGSEEEKEFREILEMLKPILGEMYKVTMFSLPPETFLRYAWPMGGPGISDIDFELSQRLEDLYRKLWRVNDAIREVSYFGEGTVIKKPEMKFILRKIRFVEKIVTEITQQEILALKNDVAKEIVRLKEVRRTIRPIRLLAPRPPHQPT